MTPDPYEAGDTSASQHCSGMPVDSPVSVQVHFVRRVSTATPACRWKMSPNEGRVAHGGEWGGGATCPSLSHPGSRKQNQSLHMCAQDVQITRTANNMVNGYNISLNYKLESLQNDPWVQKKYYRVARKSKHRCVFHRHNRRRGRPSLYLRAPAGTLGWTPVFCST
jgi:hypothetical protein